MNNKLLDEFHLCFEDDEIKWNLAWLIMKYEKIRKTASEEELIALIDKYERIIWEWHKDYFTRPVKEDEEDNE